MKTIILILVAIIAFYGGARYGDLALGSIVKEPVKDSQSKVFKPAPQSPFQNIAGEVVSSEDGLLTLKAQDGVLSRIAVSTSTVISKTVHQSLTDLKPGMKVVATGTEKGQETFSAVFLNVVQGEVLTAPASR